MHSRLAELVTAIRVCFERRGDAVVAAAADRLLAVLAAEYRSGADDPDRLSEVAAGFGLTALDQQLLTIAVAPELDGAFATAYALLQGDQAAVRATAGLALELAGTGPLDPDARGRLAPRGVLRSADLLELGGDGPFPLRALRVPERVAGLLAGETGLDPVAEAMLVAPVPVAVSEAKQLAEALAAGRPLIWITAPTGSAGLGMVAQAFEELDASLLAVDLRRRPPDVTVGDAVRIAVREAGLLLSGLAVVNADLVVTEGSASLLRLLERSPVPVAALSADAWDAAWPATIPHLVTAPMPAVELREELWREHAGPGIDRRTDQWAALVGLRLAPEQIIRASHHARFARPAEQPVEIAELRESARLVGSSGVKGTSRVRPQQGFDDLILPPSTMAPVREIVRWATHRDSVLGQGPVGGKHGGGRGITALFTGSPGTGKTLAAHVIAGELGLDLQTIDLSAVVDKYIGETEKRLEEVLSAAENLNAVLLFDEADALFGTRAEVRDARDRYANQEVSYLLQRVENFGGIAILTSNLPGNIDIAFSRRLNFLITFGDPDPATRAALWRSHLGALAVTSADDPIDIDWLAAEFDLAGGDIRNIVLASAYMAADDGHPVGMRHLRVVAERELRKLGRMPSGGRNRS